MNERMNEWMNEILTTVSISIETFGVGAEKLDHLCSDV